MDQILAERSRVLAVRAQVPLNFWDPLGFTKKLSPERKEQALLAEINNGAPMTGPARACRTS